MQLFVYTGKCSYFACAVQQHAQRMHEDAQRIIIKVATPEITRTAVKLDRLNGELGTSSPGSGEGVGVWTVSTEEVRAIPGDWLRLTSVNSFVLLGVDIDV